MDDLLKGYLERIEYSWDGEVSARVLQEIQSACLNSIPYENLNMLNRIPIEFDTLALYRKQVSEKRGGVCFELNFLLGDILTLMGFDASLLAGYVVNGFGGLFSHVALCVKLPEGRYLCDTGYARGFLKPLKLDDREWQYDGRHHYRIEQDGDWGTLFRRRYDGISLEEYRFSFEPRQREEYREMCDTLCASPLCRFTQMVVITRETPEGRLMLTGDNLYLENSRGTLMLESNLTQERKVAIIRSRFGICAEDLHEMVQKP